MPQLLAIQGIFLYDSVALKVRDPLLRILTFRLMGKTRKILLEGRKIREMSRTIGDFIRTVTFE